MFEIEQGLEPPRQRNATHYGFERLQPGDSFLVPCTMELMTSTVNRVRWAVKKHRRTHARDTKWRTAINSKGVRVWRTA